jgi:hypothetical protein
MDCVQLELYTNNSGGTKLKRNYYLVVSEQKDLMLLGQMTNTESCSSTGGVVETMKCSLR